MNEFVKNATRAYMIETFEIILKTIKNKKCNGLYTYHDDKVIIYITGISQKFTGKMKTKIQLDEYRV